MPLSDEREKTGLILAKVFPKSVPAGPASMSRVEFVEEVTSMGGMAKGIT